MGVRFKELSELGQEGETARKSKRGVNFANVKWDTGLGLLAMDTPKLEIEAIRYPVEDFEFQSARGTIQGMNLALRYPTGARPEPASIDVTIDQLILHDVALVSPDSMKSANRLDVTGVQVHAGTPAAGSGHQPSPRGGLKVPIPLVGIPLGGAWNLFLGSMWNSLAGWFGRQPHAGVSGSAAEMASLLDAGGPTGFRFSFGSLKMLGLTTSGGQYIEWVNLTDVVVQGGGDAGSYRLALNRSIERIDEQQAQACGKASAAARNATRWPDRCAASRRSVTTRGRNSTS